MVEFNYKQILIVDDDTIYAEMAKIYFEKEGYEVDIASNGIQALRMIHLSNYRLILLDYNMPHLNGMQVLEILAKFDYSNRTNVIMCTGEKTNELYQRAIELGARAILSKETEINSFFNQLTTYINNYAKGTKDVY